jgi:cyclopropane-fatty-acyl-phospholipid synthase
MQTAERLAFELTEQGYLPDIMIRQGIRHLIRQRLKEIRSDDAESAADRIIAFVDAMDAAPVALQPEKANEQHYEVPASFFGEVLGRHRKYSACYWPAGIDSLDEAEAAALEETCRRAELADGQNILELGCGWGSLTLWIARRYPRSRITAVSNSHSQRDHILSEAWVRGLRNVRVITSDMNTFEQAPERYDRIVSVEMFEHMRNWGRLYRDIATWLKPGGKFFKHIFVNRTTPYLFEDGGPGDWMSRHFFSGGMMPSDDLPLHFQQDLAIEARWRWDGTHYEKTANAWLANMDERHDAVWPILVDTYGDRARQWWIRWRIFFMACAELFAHDRGRQWWVSHYRFVRRER